MEKNEEQFLVQVITVILKNKYFKKVIIATEHPDGINVMYAESEEFMNKKKDVDEVFNQSLSDALANVIDARVKLKEERLGKKAYEKQEGTMYSVDQDGMKYE